LPPHGSSNSQRALPIQQLATIRKAGNTTRDRLHDAVISTDLEGMVIDCNRAAERIYEYSKADLAGSSVACLLFGSCPTAGPTENF
jgi:PAS domain-containing protein